MTTRSVTWFRIGAAIGVTLMLVACGKKEAVPAATPAPETTAGAPAAGEQAAATAAATEGAWTPEALEQLLAPVAIYPDVVLGHVLNASTNPQEVLDAGNWLIAHQDLNGEQIDAEAQKLGFSPSVRALLQFPETIDMMCMKMDWTTQLGQAFTADQGAVLDAVQRLRQQAKDVGNLQSSAQLAVQTEKQNDKEVVTVKPADPEVVYVPKYDPVAVYAPAPANIPPPTTIPVEAQTAAPGTTTTTTTTTTGAPVTTTTTTGAAPATTTAAATTTEQKGHSTGALITTGLLAFGAGILVNEVFSDDDDWDNYYPNYGYGGMYYGPRPYYPPPPYMYRPPYGPGFYPSSGYTRPPNYQHGFNNNTIIVNNGGNNYWNNFNRNSPPIAQTRAQSPITAARPNRPELQTLNREATDRAANRTRMASQGGVSTAQASRPGQNQYVGATAAGKADRERMVQNSARPTAATAAARPAGVSHDMPSRPQGSYAGAKNRPTATTPGTTKAAAAKPGAAKPASRPSPQQRPAGAGDRGRDMPRPTPSSRPEPAGRPEPVTRPAAPARPTPGSAPASIPTRDRSAFDSGGRSAAQERAASQRGRASKPSGAHGAQKTRR